jgi:paired amphipathic helix protein Sin3a
VYRVVGVQDPLDTTAEEEAGQEWDAMAAAPVAAADGEEQSLLHQTELQAAEGEAAAVPPPDAPSADSGSSAAEPVVQQEEETATMETEEEVDDDATQRELEAVQQLLTDETLDGVGDTAGWQHNGTNGDGAQDAGHIAQTLARRDAAGASEDVKGDAPHDDAKSAASNAEEGVSASRQLCAQEQDIKSQKPPGDAAGSDASPGASSAEAAQALAVQGQAQARQGGIAAADSAGVWEHSAAAACSAAAAKEGGGGGGDVHLGQGGKGERGEGGTAVKEEGGVTVKEEGIVTVKAEVDAAGGAAEGMDGAMMSVASIGALVNAGAQGGPTPRLPPPQSGVSSAMANAAGEGYVVRAPIPGSNKGHELKKQLKETDALEYLNLVKVQFGDSPEIYNKFLDIMKDFKSHAIDTQKVIERVSKLFAGHQRLILGFNTFLPAGYKIEVRNPAQGGGGGMNKKAAAPEFDHAYSYVSKIKQRFSNQQDVYQRFLQILQRYKEEGFAIQQVKQQVAMLFKGHEDLLGEFSNFLPDPGAPSDKLPAAQKGGKKKGGVGGKGATVQTLSALLAQGDWNSAQKDQFRQAFENLAPDQLAQQHSLLMQQQPNLIQQFIQQQQQQHGKAGGQGGGAGKGAEGEGKGKKGKKSGADAAAPEVHKEAVLLEKLKKKLVVMGDHCYMDFLKCLGLYVQDVLTANELVTVLEDMMGAPDVRDVFDELKLFLGIQKKETKYRFNVPISEIDFANCPQSGISYRSLPRDYPLPTCTGRTELCHETLNDEWVSVPSGSEDFSYTNYRKNQYEESLFKCEDDRFEAQILEHQLSL